MTGNGLAQGVELSRMPPRLAATPGFLSTISRQWAPIDSGAPVGVAAATAAAAHRARLRELLPGAEIVVAAGEAPVRNNDVRYEFRADSDFLWLCGAGLEQAVLVVHPTSTADATLYAPAPARPGEAEFFADPTHGELWVGPSPTLASWRDSLGIEVRRIDELPATIPLPPGGRGAMLAQPDSSVDLTRLLSELRRVKDEWEVAQLRAAVADTVVGFGQVAAEFPRATTMGERAERWLQGTFDRHARMAANGPGYLSIVGSGHHAATLHWVSGEGPVRADQPLLLDLGVEARSGYTADVTRTLPPLTGPTQAQQAVFDLVEASHRAALNCVAPGRPFSDFHFTAMEVLVHGLADLDLLPVSVDEALSDVGQQHRRWLVCGVGHHLGLDVHDCSRLAPEPYFGDSLEAGMVLTVEPGLYFHANDLSIPPQFRGVGVRIEDDVLVTPAGREVLSEGLPISATGLAAWTDQQLGAASSR